MLRTQNTSSRYEKGCHVKKSNKKKQTIDHQHNCIRSDQTLCHYDNETRHLPHPKRECEIDPSLCLYGCTIYEHGRGGGWERCMWVQCSRSVCEGLKKREGVRERKTAGKEERMHMKSRILSVMQFITYLTLCHLVKVSPIA